MSQLLVSTILALANQDLGKRENPGNSGWYDADMERRMTRAGWRKGWPYCATWVEDIWVAAYLKLGLTTAADQVGRLMGPSSQTTWQNFVKDPRFKTSKVPVPGALVFWKYGLVGWTGHAGLVETFDAEWLRLHQGDARFHTIEANTNATGGREGNVVAKKIRKLDFAKRAKTLNLLGFVHPLDLEPVRASDTQAGGAGMSALLGGMSRGYDPPRA